MNVTSAYGQQDILGVQATQHAQAASAGRKRHTSASTGDTVSISPEAQERAKAVQEQAQVTPTQEVDTQAATVQQAAQGNAEASGTDGSNYISLLSPTAQILNKLLLRKTIPSGGNTQQAVVAFWSEDPTEQEYFRALFKTYNGLLEEMGLGVSGPGETLPAMAPEQVKAFNEELINRLRSDVRINSLMEKFGVNAQLEETESFVSYINEQWKDIQPFVSSGPEEIDKYFTSLRKIFDAYDKGLLSAEESGRILAQYGRGEITPDYVERVLAGYASKADEKENLRESLSVGVDEFQKLQRDEEAIRRLQADERINYLMQEIGVKV